MSWSGGQPRRPDRDSFGSSRRSPPCQAVSATGAAAAALSTLLTQPRKARTGHYGMVGSGHVFPGQAAGERACRPGSVHPLARADGHPSGTAVAGSLVRSTREHRAGRPQSLAQVPRPGRRGTLLTLLRVGFTEPPGSLRALVVSYTAVSPLPPDCSGGGLFSVALSRGSPRVGVTDHPALRSPDLPRRSWRTRNAAAARPARPPLLPR